MKMEKAYCPNCGAPVFFKDGRKKYWLVKYEFHC